MRDGIVRDESTKHHASQYMEMMVLQQQLRALFRHRKYSYSNTHHSHTYTYAYKRWRYDHAKWMNTFATWLRNHITCDNICERCEARINYSYFLALYMTWILSNRTTLLLLHSFLCFARCCCYCLQKAGKEEERAMFQQMQAMAQKQVTVIPSTFYIYIQIYIQILSSLGFYFQLFVICHLFHWIASVLYMYIHVFLFSLAQLLFNFQFLFLILLFIYNLFSFCLQLMNIFNEVSYNIFLITLYSRKIV